MVPIHSRPGFAPGGFSQIHVGHSAMTKRLSPAELNRALQPREAGAKRKKPAKAKPGTYKRRDMRAGR